MAYVDLIKLNSAKSNVLEASES